MGDCGGCGSEHAQHMCEMKGKVSQEEIDKLTSNPKYECENCGAQVNEARNVCKPKAMNA